MYHASSDASTSCSNEYFLVPITGSHGPHALYWNAVQYVCLACGRSLSIQVGVFILSF